MRGVLFEQNFAKYYVGSIRYPDCTVLIVSVMPLEALLLLSKPESDGSLCNAKMETSC